MDKVRLTRRALVQAAGALSWMAALAACGATPAPAATMAPLVEASEAPEATAAPAETTAPADAGEGPVTIRWYANADPTRNKWMTDVAMPDFLASHPNYKIEPIIVPWNDFDPKLSSMFAAGDLPEVWGNWGSTGYGEYALRGMCIYQDEFIQRDAADLAMDDFPESAVEGVRIRGKITGLPLYILGTYTFYNKDLFDAVGLEYPPSDWDDADWTWDAMLATAKTLTQNYGDPNTGQYGVQTGLAFEDIGWLWGEELWEPDATTSSVAKVIHFEREGIINAWQQVADLICKHKVAPDAAIGQALSAAGDPFQAGKVAMNISGGWGFWGLKEASAEFKWGAGALPRGKSPIKDALYADPMLISSQTNLKEEAWQFVKYIDSVDGLRKFCVSTWSPPSRQSLLPDWTGLWPEALREGLEQSVKGSWKYGEVTPWNRIAGYSQFYDAINAEWGLVTTCEQQMAEVAPTIKSKVEEILAGMEFAAQ